MVFQNRNNSSSQKNWKWAFSSATSKRIAVAAGVGTAFITQSAQAITLDFSFRNLSPEGQRVLVRPPVAITPEENFDIVNRGGQVDTSLREMALTGRTAGVTTRLMNNPNVMMTTPMPQRPVSSPARLVQPNEVVTRRIEIPDDQVTEDLSAVFATPIVTSDGNGNVDGTGQFLAPDAVNLDVDESGNVMEMEQIFTTGNVFAATGDGTGATIATRPFPDGDQPLLELRVTQVDDSQAVPGPTPLLGLAAIAGTVGLLKVSRKRQSV